MRHETQAREWYHLLSTAKFKGIFKRLNTCFVQGVYERWYVTPVSEW